MTSYDRPLPVSVPRASACPGLMRIVPARDGGLARLRLAGGELSAQAARAVARAARTCGSGVIEVTNRANLQVRGIRSNAHAELIGIVLDAGLGPSVSSGDDLRNVMLSPLANDALRTLARCIVDALQADAALHALSPKFAWQLDGGEPLAMLHHPHDVWLAALDDGARFAFGFAGCMPHRADDSPAAGVIAREDAVDFASRVARVFLALALPDEHRMRDLLARIGIERFLDLLELPITQAPAWRRARADASLRFGAHADHVGAQIPLGRLDAATLDALAELTSVHAQGRMMLTPWQSVLIPDVERQHTLDVLEGLDALGLVTDPHAPFARIVACAGSSGCLKSHADTKGDAQRLAMLIDRHAGEVHLSGCPRSCASARPIESTLLAVAPGRYDLYRHARLEARNLTIEEAATRLARSHADV